MTEDEFIQLTKDALENPNGALSIGINELNQNEHIAIEIYQNYLKKSNGNHPNSPAWNAAYEWHSQYYEIPELNPGALATALPSTHNPNSSLNPQAKAFIPTTANPYYQYKEGLVSVYVFANGTREQLYIPPFKAGQIKLPDDIAEQTTSHDLKTFGSQPSEGAEMTWILLPDHKLPNFEVNGVIQVDFLFSSGKDKYGSFYNGTHEIRFIPNNPTGWLILKLYTAAFRRLNMFNLEKKIATEPYTPVFSDHSKAANRRSMDHDFPDPDYARRTIEVLNKRGITLDLLQNQVHEEQGKQNEKT